jgi:hypothetical protein
MPEDIMPGESRKVQIEDHKIWMDSVLSEFEHRLYTIAGDVKPDRHRTLANDQGDQNFVSEIVFHKQNVNGTHLLPRQLECGRSFAFQDCNCRLERFHK